MFPLLLNVTDRLAVVVGGGPVGQRKASAVLAAGGHVRLICREPQPQHLDHPCLDWRTEAYDANHLDGAALVFAAGPAALNAQIVADAQARGLWVNDADEPSRGDFFLPATVRRGNLVLAVSTSGAAPALTRTIRQRLETEFDEAFAVWLELLAEMRPLVKERLADTEQRRIVLTSLCQWHWLERLHREDVTTVRAAMRSAINSFPDPSK